MTMPDFTYDTEARRRDAVIARAMGYRTTVTTEIQPFAGIKHVMLLRPDGRPAVIRARSEEDAWSSCPRFHTDCDAIAEAFAWLLRQSDAMRDTFAFILGDKIGPSRAEWRDQLLAFLLAPPYVLAEALADAIEAEGEKR